MNETIIVAILSLIGTLIGSLAGIRTASRLTTYRLEQLEKKVDKHNNLVERTFNLEEQIALTDAKVNDVLKRLDTLERND